MKSTALFWAWQGPIRILNEGVTALFPVELTPGNTGTTIQNYVVQSREKVMTLGYHQKWDYRGIDRFLRLPVKVEVPSATPITFTIELKDGIAIGSLYRPTVFRTRDDSSWIGITVDEASSAYVKFRTDTGGDFVVSKEVDPGPMAGK